MILHFGRKSVTVKFGWPSNSRRKLRKKGQPGKRKATTKPAIKSDDLAGSTIGYVEFNGNCRVRDATKLEADALNKDLEALKNCHDGPAKAIYKCQ